ncbi:MAG: hypothetical protein NWS14_03515, partial [Pontimonas sp.]|nr:hypothetical protein [Pontimonas sp.]
MVGSLNSFQAKDTLAVGDRQYEIFRTDAVKGHET